MMQPAQTTPSLRIKTYYSPTVEEAIQQARRDLGDDAMLLRSRRSSGEGQSLGEYEVTFALSPLPEPVPSQPAPEETVVFRQRLTLPEPPAAPSQPPPLPAASGLSQYPGLPVSPIPASLNPHGIQLYIRLTGQEIPPDTALSLATAVQDALPPFPDDAQIELALRSELIRRIPPPLPVLHWATPLRAAIVGPPGAGKTSLVLKLAWRYGLEVRRPVEIWSLDGARIGAGAQLARYAELLGFTYRSFESTAGFMQALFGAPSDRLRLIDTPGFTRGERPAAAELASVLNANPEVETHLVVPASLRPEEMRRVVNRFRFFQPRSLVFSRIDEAPVFGALWELSAHSGLAASFFSAGQRIPEDLLPATPERMAALVTRSAKEPGSHSLEKGR